MKEFGALLFLMLAMFLGGFHVGWTECEKKKKKKAR